MRAAPARVGPPVRVARGPRRAAGRRSVRGVRVECRNRILFRREVRPSPRHPLRFAIVNRPDRPLLFPQEVDESDDGAESITLALGDSRSEHVRGVLKLAAGDSLRVGVVNGSPATAVVSTMDATSMTLTWRPGVETLDGDTARRSLTAPLVDVDLLLAMPRPKVMTRLWAPLASIGVRSSKKVWGVIALIAVALSRANELFCVSVRDGRCLVVRGQIPTSCHFSSAPVSSSTYGGPSA